MVKLEQALFDPSGVFKHPKDVLSCDDLSVEEKIKVLRRWEYDALEMEVAAEENMAGADVDLLPDILEALHELDAFHEGGGASNKQGGE